MPPLEYISYGEMAYYPHMAPNDVEIWNRFIKKHPREFDRVAYDVPVGAGAEFDTVVNPLTGGDVKKLYQRKIDVVAVQGEIINVIELKPRASTGAIGQVVGYSSLFRREWPGNYVIIKMIITDALVPEMDYLCKEANVRLVVV